MKKNLLILVACIILALACPVSAYNLLYEHDVGYGPSITSFTLNTAHFPLMVRDYVSFAQNVTYIEITGLTGYKADNLSKSYGPFPIQKSGVTYGNASVSWEWDPGATYSGQGSITITIHDMNPTALSGEQSFLIGNGGIPCRNWRPYQDGLPTKYGAINETPYAFSWGFSEQPNSTIKIYGGSVYDPNPPTGEIACNFDPLYPYRDNPYDLQCWPGETIYPAADSFSWDLIAPDNSTFNTDNETMIRTLDRDGWYGLNYEVCNSEGCGYYNTSELININAAFNMSGVTLGLDIRNSITGAAIHGSTTGIKNQSNGLWRYGTAPTGMVFFETTGPNNEWVLSIGETVELYGAATGFQSNNVSVTIPYTHYNQNLYLVPDYVVNATGTGTVIVTTIQQLTGMPQSGVSVSLDTGAMGMTNSVGAYTFLNVTAGTRSVTATLDEYNYIPAEESFTLAEGEVKLLPIEMLKTWQTPVETPISQAEAAAAEDPLVDTDGDGVGDTPSSLVGNYTPGQLNQRGSSGLMEMLGSLINLWPAVLVLGFFKFMKDCFE